MPRFNVSITLWVRKGFETFAKPHLQRNQEDASCAGSAIEPEKLLVKEKITASLKKMSPKRYIKCYQQQK